MDPEGLPPAIRRALVRGIAAGVTVLLVGSALVAGLNALAGGGSEPTPSPPPSPTGPPASPSPPTEPTTPAAYLAWVPGGMPDGFAEALADAPDVGDVTIALADNVWLRRTLNERGRVVDRPPAGYLLPIDATAVDLRSFSRFLPQDAAAAVRGLGDSEGILSETSAELRGIGEGGELEFQLGGSVRISGVLPDVLMGGYELLVDRPSGRRIGVRQQRYAIFQTDGGTSPSEASLERGFRRLLPAGSTYGVVEVRAPGTTRFLRMSDALLPPALIKARFGEFAARPSSSDPGFIDVEPGWVSANIAETDVPLLGTITCHRDFVPLIRRAMRELEREGLGDLVQSYGGCYAARHTLGDPSASLSHHAWGIAIDINAETNPFGSEPTQDMRLVRVMERWGMIWGGRFIVPDGHHFEYARPPQAA